MTARAKNGTKYWSSIMPTKADLFAPFPFPVQTLVFLWTHAAVIELTEPTENYAVKVLIVYCLICDSN